MTPRTRAGAHLFEDSDNEPTDPGLWDQVLAVTKGERSSVSRTVDGEEVTVEAPNDGSGFDVYPCVTMDAEALTPEGWRPRSELEVGDPVYAYNRAADVIDVTPIRALHDYRDAEVIRVGSRGLNYSFTCTPDHRVVRLVKPRGWQDDVDDTRRMLAVSRMITSGDLTYAEAREAGANGAQEFVTSYGHMTLDEALDARKNSIPQLYRVRDLFATGAQNMVLVAARAVGPSTVDWASTYVKYETDVVRRVLGMSYGERMAFLEASIMCDGALCNNNATVSRSFVQKNSDHKEAVRLAAFLTGHMVTESDRGNGRSTLHIRTRRHATDAELYFEDAGRADVWCPETDYGTWIMRQGDTVTITGNSAYANGWAVQQYNKLGGDWRAAESVLRGVVREVLREDLDQWFDEDWVDISRTDDDGNHPPCGASADDEKRKKDHEYAYPKCVPKKKAAKMSDEEKKRLTRRKRDAEAKDGEHDGDTSEKPTMTSSDPDDQRRKKDEAALRRVIRRNICEIASRRIETRYE